MRMEKYKKMSEPKVKIIYWPISYTLSTDNYWSL